MTVIRWLVVFGWTVAAGAVPVQAQTNSWNPGHDHWALAAGTAGRLQGLMLALPPAPKPSWLHTWAQEENTPFMTEWRAPLAEILGGVLRVSGFCDHVKAGNVRFGPHLSQNIAALTNGIASPAVNYSYGLSVSVHFGRSRDSGRMVKFR